MSVKFVLKLVGILQDVLNIVVADDFLLIGKLCIGKKLLGSGNHFIWCRIFNDWNLVSRFVFDLLNVIIDIEFGSELLGKFLNGENVLACEFAIFFFHFLLPLFLLLH